MDCGRFEEGLIDVALGARAPDAAEAAHLAACPLCRGRVEGERRAAEDVDRLLAEALDVEPPPALMARVRKAASDQATGNPRWGWRPALAAGILLAGLAAAVVANRGVAPSAQAPSAAGTPRPAGAAPARTAERASAAPPAARVSPAPSVSEGTASTTPRRVVIAGRSSRPLPASSEPEVLVPAGQEQALLRLVAALRSGRVGAGSLVAHRSAWDEPLPFPPPIEIPPLDEVGSDASNGKPSESGRSKS